MNPQSLNSRPFAPQTRELPLSFRATPIALCFLAKVSQNLRVFKRNEIPLKAHRRLVGKLAWNHHLELGGKPSALHAIIRALNSLSSQQELLRRQVRAKVLIPNGLRLDR
jgi:hypothetical protein